ncbi:Uncharacterised protein [uncultured archaeon]|nr:Uncharacterised protein [uncultured archaeon]
MIPDIKSFEGAFILSWESRYTYNINSTKDHRDLEGIERGDY